MKKKIINTIVGVLLLATATQAQQRRAANPALDSLRNEKDAKVLDHKLKQLGKGNEADLNLLINYYRISGDELKIDSLIQVSLEKYPNGSVAFTQNQNKLFVTKGGKAQEDLFLANKDRFPNENIDMQYYSISNAYAGEKNIPKMKEYVEMIKDPRFRSAAKRINGRTIMAYDSKLAEEVIREEAEIVYKRGLPPAPDPNDRQMNEDRPHYLEFMELYGAILVKNGKYDQALQYIKSAYDGRPTDGLKSTYGLLLSKTGKHKEALPLLDQIVASGKGSEELKQALKTSYSAVNPGENASEYLARLEKGMTAKIEAEVAQMLVSEQAPNFVVKDGNGKSVSLADFAGKTIVVDFWATWCGPCKASFPAMQKAVDKYKDDSNVEFLFIHTWEKVADPLTDAQEYLSNNKYRLDLYMDTKDEKTKTNPAVSAFGVKGIPAKFVIDGKGKIRFKVVGFSGGEDAAVAELSAMIDIAKKGS